MERVQISQTVEFMKHMVRQYFELLEFQKLAVNCIEYKSRGSLMFGELTLLHYYMFGGESDEIYKAAAAVELLILSLDIFDDLQDRDHPAMIWCQVDPAIAMNLAIGFLMLSVTIIERCTFPADRKQCILQCLNGQVLKAVNGQYSDIVEAIHTESDYLEMVRQKSGSLVACACMIGAAAATDELSPEIHSCGEHIGIAAQIKNDMRDLLRWDEKSDFLKRKKTSLTLFLMESEEPRFQNIKSYLEGRIPIEAVMEEKDNVKELLRTSGAIEYAKVLMKVNQFQALEQLNKMKVEDKWKLAMQPYILFDA